MRSRKAKENLTGPTHLQGTRARGRATKQRGKNRPERRRNRNPLRFQNAGHPRHQGCLSPEPQQESAEPGQTAEAAESSNPAAGRRGLRGSEGGARLDEPQPQADPPAAASWVFVRDLLDESAVNPEAPTSPAQAPEEAAAATAASSTGAGGPAQAGGTAQAESPADSTLGSLTTEASWGVSESSRDGYPTAECEPDAANGGSGGPAAS